MLLVTSNITNQAAPVTLSRLGTGISSRAELEVMSGDGIYYLKNDIDLAGTDWVPLNFNGTFDMSGYTISNMNVTPASSGGGHGGLFTDCSWSHIMFGRMLNASCDIGTSANYNGILAGIADNCLITDMLFQDCTVETSGDRAGSIVGLARKSAFRRVADLNSTYTGAAGSRVGSFIGLTLGYPNATHPVSYCFYNSTTWTRHEYGTTKTDAVMKAAATWVNWNPNIYNIVDGQYPTFKTLVHTDIATRTDLDNIVAAGGIQYGLFRLVADIDCSGSDFIHNGTDFRGDLDGNGFNITNCNRAVHTGAREGVIFQTCGFMGTTRNLHLTGEFGATSTTSGNYQGLICGNADAHIFSNVATRGVVNSGGDRAGGFAGFGNGMYVHKCIAGANVGSSGRRGGFMGFEWNSGANYNLPWQRGAVNATSYTGNTFSKEEMPNQPENTNIWSNPTATTAANYTAMHYSTDLWVLDNASLPTFVPK